MPIVHIHVQRGRWAAERTALLEGVHAALVEAFEIPESDRNQILHEHEPDHFEAQRGAGFAIVEITAFPGRSAEAKRVMGDRVCLLEHTQELVLDAVGTCIRRENGNASLIVVPHIG